MNYFNLYSEKIVRRVKNKYLNPILAANKPKIFCVGCNKTGTTSIKRALSDFGYIIGNQKEAERLFPFYKVRDFNPVINYCKKAEAFQDSPFSLPYTFIPLDHAFPKSKFILTIRENPEVWYNSLVVFHSRIFGEGSVPTVNQLKSALYNYQGFPYEAMKVVYGTQDEDIYNKEILINNYTLHNNLVRDYFKFRSDDLLILNLNEEGSYIKLCEFLKKKPLYDSFPWENKAKK